MLGPVIDERQRDKIHALVCGSASAGGRVAAGGHYDRLFYQPTVLADVHDEPNIPFGGGLACGTGARFGGMANLDAFTEPRWVTVRGDIAPYPF